MDRCVFCQGELDATGRFCRQCGQMQPERAVSAPIGASASAPIRAAMQEVPTQELKKTCPSCGLELPVWARFCGNCAYSFSEAGSQPGSQPVAASPAQAPSAPIKQTSDDLEKTLLRLDRPQEAPQAQAEEEERRRSGMVLGPVLPIEPPGLAGSGPFSGPVVPGMSTAPAWAQPGMPGMSFGSQASMPGMPGMAAGPQAGVPGMPGMAPGAQAGAPGMSGMAPGAQASAPGMPGMSAPHLGGVPPGSMAPPAGWPQPPAGSMPSFSGSGWSPPGYSAPTLSGPPAAGAPSTTLGQVAGHGAARGLGYKLWGTLTAKIISIAVATTVVVGGGAATVYAVTRPNPVIQATSKYHVGSTVAGSPGTSLHLSGQKFSTSSFVTLQLDGRPLPGSQPAVESDSNGGFQTTVTITEAWTAGRHVLTAKDAKDYATKNGVPVMVVAQGEAGTPGPNGAPPDDATFSVSIALPNAAFWYFPDMLQVTGQPDPAGGTVCQGRDQSGGGTQDGPIFDENTGQPTGITFHETITFSCTGSYKSGTLTYVETAVSDTFNLSNGVICQGNTPRVIQSLNGTFTGATSINGSWSADALTLNCTQAYQLRGLPAQQDHWTGSAALAG